MNKFLLFTTGGGSTDLMGLSNDEIAIYNSDDLKSIKPASKSTIEMVFESRTIKDIVTLTVLSSRHGDVISSITKAITTGLDSVVKIADVDNDYFINKHINGVSIESPGIYIQKITGNTKTKLNLTKGNFSSCLISNTDGSAAVSCTLHLTSKLGSDITDTGTNANESDNAATTSSVTLTVDGTAATSDIFAGEQVWKSDGTLFGTCTARDSNTQIVFGGGIEETLADDADLYGGTTYVLMDAYSISANSYLKLVDNEISFDTAKYNLYVTSGDSDGQLTFKFNY